MSFARVWKKMGRGQRQMQTDPHAHFYGRFLSVSSVLSTSFPGSLGKKRDPGNEVAVLSGYWYESGFRFSQRNVLIVYQLPNGKHPWHHATLGPQTRDNIALKALIWYHVYYLSKCYLLTPS